MANDAKDAANERPSELKLGIDTGMLESLGLNMYTSVGKSLVEFVANGFDADAGKVTISIPFDRIDEARAKLRETAKAEVKAGTRDKIRVLQDPLPADIEIVIEDSGHGMTGKELQDKFLMINRNRRKEDKTSKSESGKRMVMGRKGLGKLAGFGTAELVSVWTKRAGETYATRFDMDFDTIRAAKTAADVRFTPKYEDGLPSEKKGTIVRLSRLRCDAIRAKEPAIRYTLAQNFAVMGEAFVVELNNERVVQDPVDYEFKWPPDDQCDEDGFANMEVMVADLVPVPLRYRTMFRPHKSDDDEEAPEEKAKPVKTATAATKVPVAAAKAVEEDGGQEEAATEEGVPTNRGSLPARLRGARIYCNKRLAAGPSLFELHSGTHNFHAQSYMECIVHADELDRHDVDLTSTNRTDLKGDNEAVDAVIKAITGIMREALKEHAKFREAKAEEELKKDPTAKAVMKQVEFLTANTRKPAERALTMLASRHGVKSKFFRQVAPLVVSSMSTGEVLVKLAEMATDPKSITLVGHELAELAKIEYSDVLKLYRGRRSAIQALQRLQEKSDDDWKGNQFEGELHQLLKENAWLIELEFSRYLTSDSTMGDVAKALNKELKIDSNKPKDYDPEKDKDNTRPDLVFLLADATQAARVTVVEFKSPNIPLTAAHVTQLEGYMAKVEDYLDNEYKTSDVSGYLIGSLPDPKTKNSDELVVIKRYQKAQPAEKLQIIPLTKLLERAKDRHMGYMEVLAKEEKRLADDLK